MGKNTMMKRCIKVYAEEKKDDKWNVLLDYLVGNVGIIFTTVSVIYALHACIPLCALLHFRWRRSTLLQGELNNIRDEIMKFKVGAPARVGLVAPNAVEVPAGGTGLDPSSTNFFQVCPISSIFVCISFA